MIDALNRDLPFDQFTIEQIAGDMLPEATDPQRNLDQKIATGFHRNAMTNEEGGVDPDESMYEALVDRVNTTATVWLGSTIGCAQCHNHKYDPFSQKDYFRLLAFFANSDYESRTFGDGTRYFEGRLDLATPAAGGGPQARAGRHRRARAGAQDDDAGGSRRAGTVGAVVACGRAILDTARARARDRHERRDADRAPRPLAPGVGPEPGAHLLRDHGRHHGAGDNRAASRNAARPLAAEERPGP